MSTNPLRTGPDGWSFTATPVRDRYVCDQCGYAREFAVPRRTPVYCKHDNSQMREVEEVR